MPSRRSAIVTTVFLSLLAAAGLDVLVLNPANVAQVLSGQASADRLGDINVLSARDRFYYREAIKAQSQGNFGAADSHLAQVSDGLLLPVVRAERLLTRHYNPSYDELAAWLQNHADLPRADKIYQKALAVKPAQASAPAEPLSQGAVKQATSGYGKSVLRDMKAWQAGVNAYKAKNPALALRHFSAILDKAADSRLSTSDRSAAAFWAYRAARAAGDKPSGQRYLKLAADQPLSFYSIIARNLLGQPHAVVETSAGSADADIRDLMDIPPVRRAVALREIGQDALAELELRKLYPVANAITRARLLTLAHRLSLPAIQMHIASGAANEIQAFPVPNWEPHSGYQIEKALLYAIMRQESGFNPNARSSAGALGLMQLMPATARAMTRGNNQLGSRSLDPAVNITLGQRYLEHLMDTSHIGDNLVYLMAAYNAGPGSLANWLRTTRISDPLLFIETIPFDQTRDYVVNVMANYWVYSELLEVGQPESLQMLAKGEWPRYDRPQNQLISLLSRTD